jgi:hypothetical protein
MYSEICRNQISLGPTFVFKTNRCLVWGQLFFLEIERCLFGFYKLIILTKISYIEALLFKVLFSQDSILFSVQIRQASLYKLYTELTGNISCN